MKKAQREADELRNEYKRSDFGKLVRGKYVERIKQSTNVVVLDPDVAAAFPNDKIVNDTLRRLLELAKSSTSDK
jgi:hypothetical protein